MNQVYLLGVGQHFFAGVRLLRSERLPAEEGGGRLYWQARFHSEEALDEHKKSVSIRDYDIHSPALFASVKTEVPIAPLGEGTISGLYSDNLSYAWTSVQFWSPWDLQEYYQRFPLEWSDVDGEREIVFAIPRSRKFAFYVVPADVF